MGLLSIETDGRTGGRGTCDQSGERERLKIEVRYAWLDRRDEMLRRLKKCEPQFIEIVLTKKSDIDESSMIYYVLVSNGL